MSDEILDVAIVGAGAAGTYTAWRLANDKNQDSSKVKVFDYLKIDGKPHIGGRLWSTHLPGLGYTRKAEMGGMRFLTSQEIVVNVVEQLKLTSVPFDVDSIDNLYNLRAEVLRTSEITDPDKVPYKLAPLERGKSPGSLLIYAVETIVPNAPYLTSEEWVEVKKNFKVNGRNLYDMGLWNLLEQILSEEGYQYVYDGQGYNTIPSNWNAADALQWILEDFAADVSYRYVQEGYQCVPEKLLAEATESGVGFQENSKLLSWSKGADGIIDLVFESTENGGANFTVKTKKLVLAMPKKALELVKMPQSPDMEMLYDKLLPAVQPQPMFKFFLGYKNPWWRTLGMTSGRTITDNPLRQIYYWGSNYQHFFDSAPDETGGITNDPENSVLMIYLDGRDVSYWQPLFELLNTRGDLLNVNSENHFDVLKVYSANVNSFLGDLKDEIETKLKKLKDYGYGDNRPDIQEIVLQSTTFNAKLDDINQSQAALANLLETITTLLMRAHGVQFIPEPYTFAYADWTADPFGGAYNLWKPGFKSWEVTKDIIKPIEDTEVYIVGEAYSLKQGWVEGAFETAEQMLETYFNLDQPDWLSKSYNIE